MAYASIAGLPPVYGLYSAFMGVLVYFFTGTSKDITLGPTALMSLIVAESFTELPHLYNETYVGVDVDVDLLRAQYMHRHPNADTNTTTNALQLYNHPPGGENIMYYVFCILYLCTAIISKCHFHCHQNYFFIVLFLKARY